MDLAKPLNGVLGRRGALEVMRALVSLPEGLSVSGRDLARRSSVSHPTVLSVAADLYQQGMLSVARQPKRDAYSLNRTHILSKKMVDLFSWEESLPEQVRAIVAQEIKRLVPSTRLALLYGSPAGETATATSDIDLFLLVPKSSWNEESGLELADAIRMRLGNQVSVIAEHLEKREFLQKSQRNRFWAQILKTGAPVVGNI